MIFWTLPFLFATGHRHIFCSSWSPGISLTKKFALLARTSCLKNLFLNCRSIILKERNNVNCTRESADMKTFDQSEHDTRIWYHGTAASKACLQAPMIYPQPSPRLTLLTYIFPIRPWFLPFPSLWSLVPGYLSGGFFCSHYRRSKTGRISGSWPLAWATYLGGPHILYILP